MCSGEEVIDLKALSLREFTEIFSDKRKDVQPHKNHREDEPDPKPQL